MEDNKTHWRNLATERFYMRYPYITLMVSPPLRYDDIKIRMETFVKVKDRLMFVADSYIADVHVDIFESIPFFKERFIEKCELIKDKAIFNEQSSILDPYTTTI
jgi:hypothetical protein